MHWVAQAELVCNMYNFAAGNWEINSPWFILLSACAGVYYVLHRKLSANGNLNSRINIHFVTVVSYHVIIIIIDFYKIPIFVSHTLSTGMLWSVSPWIFSSTGIRDLSPLVFPHRADSPAIWKILWSSFGASVYVFLELWGWELDIVYSRHGLTSTE